jgi:hypothetical protein
MALTKATLTDVSTSPAPPPIEVLFNPTEYGIERGAFYAQLPVPGLKTPILQFIRGEAEHLVLELFLDGTNQRQKVETALESLRKFVRIDAALHAPPVCRFDWGDVHFQGVVVSLREKLALFDDRGAVVRARVTLTLRSYQSAEVQLRELRRQSPDRTHVRVLREGETLSRIAAEAYGDPKLWRPIAEANGIDRPRFVPPGTALVVPAL